MTAVWFRFERDGAILGYCGPEEQTFVGGYSMYHPFNKQDSVCILEMRDKIYGVYTCTTEFPGVMNSFTSTNNVTLTPDKPAKDYLDVAIGLGSGFVICFIIMIVLTTVVIGIFVCCNRHRDQQERNPLLNNHDDLDGNRADQQN